MTLITHLRNSHLAIIAGDSKNTSSLPIGNHLKARKVYDFKDCIIGYYGSVNGFVLWLEHDIGTDDKRLNNGVVEIINKAKEIIEDDRSFGIVIADFEKSVLLLHPSANNIELIDLKLGCNQEHEMHEIINSSVFFSPQRNRNRQIDSEHNFLLNLLFTKRFKDVYNHELDLELIQNDEKLEGFLNMFYSSINSKQDFHLNVIGGPVKYHVIDIENKIISPLFIAR